MRKVIREEIEKLAENQNLLKTRMKLMKITEKRLRQIIREEIFTSQTGNRLTYDPKKMMRFVNKDAMLTFQFKDMMRRIGDRKEILRILFNSEVMGDSTMEQEYMNA